MIIEGRPEAVAPFCHKAYSILRGLCLSEPSITRASRGTKACFTASVIVAFSWVVDCLAQYQLGCAVVIMPSLIVIPYLNRSTSRKDAVVLVLNGWGKVQVLCMPKPRAARQGNQSSWWCPEFSPHQTNAAGSNKSSMRMHQENHQVRARCYCFWLCHVFLQCALESNQILDSIGFLSYPLILECWIDGYYLFPLV